MFGAQFTLKDSNIILTEQIKVQIIKYLANKVTSNKSKFTSPKHFRRISESLLFSRLK